MKHFLFMALMCIYICVFSINAVADVTTLKNYDVQKTFLRDTVNNTTQILDEKNNLLFTAKWTIEYQEIKSDAEVSIAPNKKIKKGILPKGAVVLEVAEAEQVGWSLIFINNTQYFIESQYLMLPTKNDFLLTTKVEPVKEESKIVSTKKKNPTKKKTIKEVKSNTNKTETETETKVEGKTFLGKWRLTEYCARCNSGSATATASGKRAEAWYTCAVSHSNYRKWKGKKLYIEGWGIFEIQDWGSVSGCDKSKWVDLYLPKSYHNHVWTKANVYLID